MVQFKICWMFWQQHAKRIAKVCMLGARGLKCSGLGGSILQTLKAFDVRIVLEKCRLVIIPAFPTFSYFLELFPTFPGVFFGGGQKSLQSCKLVFKLCFVQLMKVLDVVGIVCRSK